jgi:hypothetical protein
MERSTMSVLTDAAEPDFYLPRNTGYGIMASAMDSARYAVAASVPCAFGCNAPSFLTDIDAKPIRSAGRLVQGIGYCADSAFAAGALRRFGALTGQADFVATADGLTTHIFETGYLADPDIPVRLYQDAETGAFFDQVEARSAYFDLGHMARPLEKLLDQSDSLTADQRAMLHRASLRLADWIVSAERTPQGWLPRRVDGQLKTFRGIRKPAELPADVASPFDKRDHTLERSGAGLLAVAFLLKLHQLRLRALTEDLTALCDSFVEHGGFFGSINTDTEDLHESVAYAIGFQVLLAASQFLGRPVYRDFAHDVCLAGLRVFRINRDLNDLPTKGLTRLAANYSSACFWENAEVALAYFQAARDTGNQLHARDGMTILRAIARNRIGSNGFLTAELDWDGRLPPEKHVGATARGPRVVTHPYMNSLNLLAPTLFYLQHLAWKSAGEPPVFHDLEGVQLWPI